MNRIRTAKKTDQKYIIAAMLLAFDHNPLMRWIYPDAYQYLHHFPHLIQNTISSTFDCRTADMIQGYSGAALWLPPGITPDDDRQLKIIEQSTFESDQIPIVALLKQLQQYRPQIPHWSLPIIGIEPTKQGYGYGSALMKYGLARCDRQAAPVYLEATTPIRVAFYQRYGFEQLDQVQIGNSPLIFPMLRQPK
ncbi:GNAT family N-acetyltransferase [filamentous cyanobacterium LEGE 11480]|uniref:GNAT family N-acetyltransferase n=1 Tax=Romeriopsis navalis LEGE 11480 TaxID=2777977 RepID=A0A928VJX4_9CYAN|nr:GNAT family N-acetyltransferase [Romeriopsis navalis]MBE9029007.1 GNAT family N-acetyltransferase [Romeriopsis navalis LEGE 11480]